MRQIAVLDAPSNLGLRPPTPTSVPGCAKAPGALRDHGLLARLGARDAGCLTPRRYDPGDWRPGDGVCHADEIAGYSQELAERIGAMIDQGEFPVVLGGDCSILIGSALAMHRLGEAVGGRIGLVFVDGHSDFRHPGNASYVGAAAGEDLALVTGRGQPDLASIEGRRPYFRDIDVVVLGIRAQDEYRLDLQAAGIITRPVPQLRAEGAARTAQWAHDELADCVGYWVHVDVDVLDPAVMPAVDAPEPGGIAFPELEILLAGLVDTPHCLGMEITVFDPDYDPDGAYAAEIVSTLVAGLAPVAEPAVAASRTLAGRSDRLGRSGGSGGLDGSGGSERSGRDGAGSRVPAARVALDEADARAVSPAGQARSQAPSALDRPEGGLAGPLGGSEMLTERLLAATSRPRAQEADGIRGRLGDGSPVTSAGSEEHPEGAGEAESPDPAADEAGRKARPSLLAPRPADEGPVWPAARDPEPVGPPGLAGPGRLRRSPAMSDSSAAPEPSDDPDDTGLPEVDSA